MSPRFRAWPVLVVVGLICAGVLVIRARPAARTGGAAVGAAAPETRRERATRRSPGAEARRRSVPRERSQAPPALAADESPAADTGFIASLGWLTLEVRDPDGDRGYAVCDGPQGRWEMAVQGRVGVAPGAYTCQAVRDDGVLVARSDEVEFTVAAGDEVEVLLELPAERTGGIGIAFEPTPEGMRVLEVFPGSPAERAGLQPGDLVVEVDGSPAALLGSDDFVATLTGAEGSAVELVTAWASDTGFAEERHVLRRSFLREDEDGNIVAEPVDTGEPPPEAVDTAAAAWDTAG